MNWVRGRLGSLQGGNRAGELGNGSHSKPRGEDVASTVLLALGKECFMDLEVIPSPQVSQLQVISPGAFCHQSSPLPSAGPKGPLASELLLQQMER